MPDNMKEVLSSLDCQLADIINLWNETNPDVLVVWIKMLIGDLEALQVLAEKMSLAIKHINREDE